MTSSETDLYLVVSWRRYMQEQMLTSSTGCPIAICDELGTTSGMHCAV
jgi:hypothetical protein